MPISISANDELCLRVVWLEGTVSSEELEGLVAGYGQNRAWLDYDSIYLIEADSADIDTSSLDLLKRQIFDQYRQTEFIVRRRSAWICKVAETRMLVEYWLTGRHIGDGSGAEFCIGVELDDALDLYSQEELNAVKTGMGFRPLARINAKA